MKNQFCDYLEVRIYRCNVSFTREYGSSWAVVLLEHIPFLLVVGGHSGFSVMHLRTLFKSS